MTTPLLAALLRYGHREFGPSVGPPGRKSALAAIQQGDLLSMSSDARVIAGQTCRASRAPPYDPGIMCFDSSVLRCSLGSAPPIANNISGRNLIRRSIGPIQTWFSYWDARRGAWG